MNYNNFESFFICISFLSLFKMKNLSQCENALVEKKIILKVENRNTELKLQLHHFLSL